MYDLISSHGAVEDMVFFAILMKGVWGWEGWEGCVEVRDVVRKDDERKIVSATMLAHGVLTLSPLLPPSTLPPLSLHRL